LVAQRLRKTSEGTEQTTKPAQRKGYVVERRADGMNKKARKKVSEREFVGVVGR